MSNHENFSEVLNRAMAMLKDHGYNFKQDVICMDLMNADINFTKMLELDDFGFSHDLFGIIKNMNRQVIPARLENCFLPYSAN